MVNHFRTLLLNLPQGDALEEYIPTDFSSVTLPTSLSGFYNTVYPQNSSRRHKLFLTQAYLNLIDTTDYREHVLNADPRITYDLKDGAYFQIDRVSPSVASDPTFPLFTQGSYGYTPASTAAFDMVQVAQIGSSFDVVVTSMLTGKVYCTATLAFTGTISAPVTLTGTGVSFFIVQTADFTSTANKLWTFNIESPYAFDFATLYSQLSMSPTVVEAMLGFNKSMSTTTYENLWRQHFNPVFKVAGLLLAYGERVNQVYED